MGQSASLHRESAEEVWNGSCKASCYSRWHQHKFVKATESDESVEQQQYQSVVGRLLYLAMGT